MPFTVKLRKDLGVYKDKLISVFTKAAVKGLIWYDKANYTGGAPATWQDLEGMSPAPASSLWCIGFESGAALATVVGVLVEVPVMLLVVRVVNRSKGWYQRDRVAN